MLLLVCLVLVLVMLVLVLVQLLLLLVLVLLLAADTAGSAGASGCMANRPCGMSGPQTGIYAQHLQKMLQD